MVERATGSSAERLFPEQFSEIPSRVTNPLKRSDRTLLILNPCNSWLLTPVFSRFQGYLH